MSTPKMHKFLLIWQNKDSKNTYFLIRVSSLHSVCNFLELAQGHYLNDTDATDKQKNAIVQIHGFVKDTNNAAPLSEANLCKQMGWDRVYSTGVQK